MSRTCGPGRVLCVSKQHCDRTHLITINGQPMANHIWFLFIHPSICKSDDILIQRPKRPSFTPGVSGIMATTGVSTMRFSGETLAEALALGMEERISNSAVFGPQEMPFVSSPGPLASCPRERFGFAMPWPFCRTYAP